nr:multidrug efflux SMR transporter [Actinoplanes tereljensis]
MYERTRRGATVSYVYLLAAIAAEIVATSLMKSTEGFTRLWPTVVCLAGYAISLVALSQAVKGVPVGVAYALWSALGTAAIVAIGAAFLGEPITLIKVAGVSLIIAGVVTLNLGGSH